MNKKPTFQENKFRTNNQDKRQSKPQKPRFSDKPRREKPVEKTSIWGGQQQLTAHKANQTQGEVNVRIKSSAHAVKEKKTGPLSPRAPEKIRQNRAEEVKVYGELACLTLFEHRPQDIVRLWVTQELSKKAGEMMSYLANNKKAYHVVKNDEMQRVTGTEHHGGICLLVKKRPPLSLSGYLTIPRQRDCIVLLDGVGNAANIGGVLKTLAFYGVQNVITDNIDLVQSPASMRVAEGGIEFLRLFETEHPTLAIDQLQQAGYQIVRASLAKQATPLDHATFADKVVLVLSENMWKELDPNATNIALSRSNQLASGLNIAVTAGVLLAKWYF
ncbi:TrmH family RNA methyltransferase [Gallibacterium trehalosifermentans]|uniref:TrmH family RNA methyltransferase n=1 Tax=Gallibacterium trehalosifermentans TaxID=516935 RepID=A0ABV6H1R7_9PAST